MRSAPELLQILRVRTYSTRSKPAAQREPRCSVGRKVSSTSQTILSSLASTQCGTRGSVRQQTHVVSALYAQLDRSHLRDIHLHRRINVGSPSSIHPLPYQFKSYSHTYTQEPPPRACKMAKTTWSQVSRALADFPTLFLAWNGQRGCCR